MASLLKCFRHTVITAFTAVSVVAVLVVADQVADLSFVADASAQDAPKKKERETRKTPALRNNIYEKLAEAQVFAEEKQYVEAEEVLNAKIITE